MSREIHTTHDDREYRRARLLTQSWDGFEFPEGTIPRIVVTEIQFPGEWG